MKKYELTDVTKIISGVTVRRIKSLIDFYGVKAGDLGGWIEKESNLAQDDLSWVYDDAAVFGDAKVFDNACIYDNAVVFNNAKVYGNARVYGTAKVFDNACIYGNASAYGDAIVYGDACIYDNAILHGNASVSGNARVYGSASVCDNAEVRGDAVVAEEMRVTYSVTDCNLLDRENLAANIESQTGLKVFNGEVYCYKHVRKDLSSIYDANFKYVPNTWACAEFVDQSNESCAAGLHVSNAHYWNGQGGQKVLFCKVKLEDIITVQEGKIRCSKLFVIGVCDGPVF